MIDVIYNLYIVLLKHKQTNVNKYWGTLFKILNDTVSNQRYSSNLNNNLENSIYNKSRH